MEHLFIDPKIPYVEFGDEDFHFACWPDKVVVAMSYFHPDYKDDKIEFKNWTVVA